MNEEKELAQTISNAVNNMSFDSKKFAVAMSNQHRTLQQNAFRLFCEWTKSLAEAEHYDERNKASVMLAKKLAKVIEEDGTLPYI